MATHPHLDLSDTPALNRPHLVVAWAGFNDAGESATHAARHLAASLDATAFGSIDPEEYYDFTEARPFARYVDGERDIVWPTTDFYYAKTDGDHDLIIALGIEPNHRWKSYMAAFNEVIETLKVEMTYTLGAVAAQVPHTRPSTVRGSANMSDLADRFDMHPSRFEGPTGIVGVFHHFTRQHDHPAISLWANVPHYLPGVTNPVGSRALLQKLSDLTGATFDFDKLDQAAERFRKQASLALEENADLAAYVHQLEEAAGDPEPEEPSELPTADSLIESLEDFLRDHRSED